MIGGRVKAAVLLRSLAIQGSWNYETLTGTGFGFAILPALREIYGDPAELDVAVRRHERSFNSHPYLAPLALGAVIRLEVDGEDPETIDRFKAALRGSLGTLGDQLVWAGWRPVCLLGALALLLLGTSWWVTMVTFLVLYNLGHVGVMYWGLSVGLTEGRGVAERLRGSVRSTQPRLMAVGACLAGVVMVLIASGGIPALGFQPGLLWGALAAAGVIAGARLGERIRRSAVGVVIVLALVGAVLGVVS